MEKKYPRATIDMALQLNDEQIQDLVELHETFKMLLAAQKTATAYRDAACDRVAAINKTIDEKINELTE